VSFVGAIYTENRLYYNLGAILFLVTLGYLFDFFFVVGTFLLVVLLALVTWELFFLNASRRGLRSSRLCAARFSNGDDNQVELYIENRNRFSLDISVIDEMPFQFQERHTRFELRIPGGKTRIIRYKLKPVARGEYHFGYINVFIRSILGLLSYRLRSDQQRTIKVYPSYLQMRKYELMAISSQLTELGIKRIRKIGHHTEFEHIKEYVKGDDYRTINWKATARKGHLMVNIYQDEKSQNVYSLIDKGRVMKMPFVGMTLLDYAINAALVISNIAINKEDKAGIVSFEKDFEGYIPASKRRNQMQLILQYLYNQRTTFGETDYSRVYINVKKIVNRRSLLLLYTNFESVHSLERQLPYFKALSRHHVLVVIFFYNTELDQLITADADTVKKAYHKVIAEKFVYEKRQIVKTLQRYGIHTILSKPEELNVNVINKYLELKSRRII